MKRVVLALCVVASLNPQVTVVKREVRFKRMLHQKEPSVILFYHQSSHENGSTLTDFKKLYRIFNSVAQRQRYVRAHLRFSAVNLGRSGFEKYQSMLGLYQFPCVAIIGSGSLYTDDILTGDFDADDIEDYIENVLEDVLDTRLKKSVACSSDYENSPYYFYRPPYYYYNPYCYWDWPYCGYYGYPCYGGPSLGFGFTVGI